MIKKDSYYIKLGKNIEKKRKQLGLTNREVANHLKIRETYLYKYEKGLVRIPVDKLFALAVFYKTNLLYFFEGIETEFPPTDIAEQLKVSIDPLLTNLEAKIRQFKNIKDKFQPKGDD